jgi:hypothetical protein
MITFRLRQSPFLEREDRRVEKALHLVLSPCIPEDRRVVNALELVAGLRPGETAALRWSHYDITPEPLGHLTVAVSWDSRLEVETTTKTERTRAVPVHPTLAKILAAWKVGGWAAQFGRAPRSDDLIVPNRDGEHRNPQRAVRRFHEDLQRLGLRRRRQHDCRRTFISLARGDGARADILRWVTHGRTGDIVDVYTTLPWEALCAEVAKLRLDLRQGKVLEFRKVASGPCDSPCDSPNGGTKKPSSHADLRAFSDEREKGFEPSTLALARRCSTAELFPRDCGEARALYRLPEDSVKSFPHQMSNGLTPRTSLRTCLRIHAGMQ